MKLMRLGQAARLLKLTARQLVERERGDHIVIYGYRMKVYQEHPGAHRFFNTIDVIRAVAAMARQKNIR